MKKWIKENLRDLYWEIYGNTIKNSRFPDDPKSLLFVCKGNICRSPFAEHIARNLSRNGVKEGMAFFSAGLEVSQPFPPPKEAISAAKSFGVQLNGHKSRRFTQEMVETFDMIIAMESWQFRTLRKAFPSEHDKIFLLPLFDVTGWTKLGRFFHYNIQDPYGQSLDEFSSCFQRIKRCIEGLFEEMEGARRG